MIQIDENNLWKASPMNMLNDLEFASKVDGAYLENSFQLWDSIAFQWFLKQL